MNSSYSLLAGEQVDFGAETLMQRFFAVAQHYPHRPAIYNAGLTIDYTQLAANVRAIAAALRRYRLTPGQRVGLLIGEDSEKIALLLGMMAAGVTFVPLSNALPAARVEDILLKADCSAVILDRDLPLAHSLLTTGGLLSQPDAPAIIDLTAFRQATRQIDDEEHEYVCHDVTHGIAYCLFTSGSTGKPKCVEVSYGALLNTLCSTRHMHRYSAQDCSILLTDFSFDAAFVTIFCPLLGGGSVVTLPGRLLKNHEDIWAAILQHRVTILQGTPIVLAALAQHWQTLPQRPHHALRLLMSGGDVLTPTMFAQLQTLDAEAIANHYGPTEIAIDAACGVISDSDDISIGVPICNARCYLVDAQLALVPAGEVGELLVASPGLARGYRGDRVSTEKAFITSARLSGLPQSERERGDFRLYRTGDLARIVNGKIVLLGRNDRQIKIRGVRGDLNEIEGHLRACAGVQEARVLVQQRPIIGRVLAAYVSESQPGAIAMGALRQHLQQMLPAQMVPTYCKRVAYFPLNKNGKPDEEQFPPVDQHDLLAEAASDEPYQNRYETLIAELCAKFLQIDPPSRHAGFQELGAHSLLLTRMANLLSDKLAIHVTAQEMFVHRDIRSLAHWCEKQTRSEAPPTAAQRPIAAAPAAFPLSSGQKLIWFSQQMHPDSSAYNVPLTMAFNRPIAAQDVEQALAHLWQRHAMLRVKFHHDTASAVPDVYQSDCWQTPPTLQHKDLSAYSNAAYEAAVAQLIEQPFDLQQERAMRAVLIRTPAQQDTLILTIHHLVCDGWSIGVLHRELLAALRMPQAALASADRSDAAIYHHLVQRAQADNEAPAMAQKLAWWRQQFRDLPTLPFPTDYPRPAFQSLAGDVVTWRFSTAQSARLRALAKHYDASLFQTMLSLFVILLQRYAQSTPVSVGIPTAGRDDRRYEECVGLFINTLVLATDVVSHDSFADVLHKVKANLLAAMQHEVPFEALLNALAPPRDTTRSPLFQIMFDYHYEDIHRRQEITPELSCLSQPTQTRSAKFDLALDVYQADEITLMLEYASALFARESMEQFIRHFVALTEACLQTPDALLSNMPLFAQYATLNERHAAARPAAFQPILSLLYQQVDQHGARIAVADGERQLSYRQLDDYSSHVAQRLIQAGVSHEDIVAVHLPRSLEYVVAVVAVLKSNAAFMPLDPAQPPQRLAMIAHASQAKAVLHCAALSPNAGDSLFHFTSEQIFNVDLSSPAPRDAPPRPPLTAHPQQLAYIFYTSGSTGTPKGVMLSQAGLSNQLRIKVEEFALRPGDGIGFLATPGFDVSVWQTLTALTCGATTVIFPDVTAWDPPALLQHCRRMEVACIETVPSHFNQLLNYLEQHDTPLPALRFVMLNGEPLLAEHCRRWLKCYPHIPLVNGYGATEVSDDCSHCVIGAGDTIAQHKPMPVNGTLDGYQMYVLDPQLNIVPPGAVGEICVAGIGVARGYLQDPVKTACQFVPNPYGTSAGEVLYRSGDMASYDAAGRIYYLGRQDNQLKINGVRVELAEIDAALRSLPQVEHAFTCIDDANPQHKTLLAFIVPRDAQPNGFSVDALRPLLTQQLPVHIIPKHIIPLSAFPLKPNGKIDKNALMSLADGTLSTHAPAGKLPGDRIETQLIHLWSETLGKSVTYTDQNFFEAGGHSMSGMAILARIQKQFTVQISLKEFYQNATVAALAHYVKTRQNRQDNDGSEQGVSNNAGGYSIEI